MTNQEDLSANVHPMIRALEQNKGSAVILRGYLGSNDEKKDIVCLYPALDTSSRLEIPRQSILHLELEPGEEPQTCSVYVLSDAEVRSIQEFPFKANELRSLEPLSLRPRIPPAIRRDFWTCAEACTFKLETSSTSYNEMLANALAETNPVRRELLLNTAEGFRTRAIGEFLACLNDCDSKFPNGHPGISIGQIHQYHVQRLFPS